jgi:TP901 family phage tail tape measure protein
MAFQIDFLVGRGSRRNAINSVRDTVDSINLVARTGANKAAKERKATLEQQLGELDELAKQSAQDLVKQKENTAKAIAKRAGYTAGLATKRLKADTSALDAVGKKTVSIAKQMKTAFTSLNKSIEAEGGKQLAGKGFTTAETATDFADRGVNARQKIVDLMREENEAAKKRGTLTEGMIHNLRIAEDLQRQITDLERDAAETGRNIEKEKAELVKEYNLAQNEANQELQDEIYLRQQQGQAISNIATSVKDTLRNSFIYATAAITAFYYKLNEVNQTFAEFENELINAQSIFQTSQDTLFGLSDAIAEFGLNYGVELQNASTGLYQMASAGLSAEDSLSVLNDTLTLSMAVQGDHNTISKLTTQTLFGFGMEMDQSGILVDKFAHAINKSLIEYQDLASAVKFAMPFFVSTGQSVDQLLGSLQVLTNRALEAGIAGRGLRQAMAEFAEGAEDATRQFAQLGVKVLDNQGNMLQLTEIARNFAHAFPDINDNVKLMTTLLEDLNVRGATAFVHLVQNVEEFEGAVDDLQNAHGAAQEMAEIQQASISNQMQILKNAMMAPFILTDEIGRANGFMNEFHMTLHQIVSQFSDLIYTTLPDGQKVLTDVGKGMKMFVIDAMKQLSALLHEGMILFKAFAKEAGGTTEVLNMLTVPLRAVLKILQLIGPQGIQFILMFKVMNGILPITSLLMLALTNETIALGIANLFMAVTEETKAAALNATTIAAMGAYGALGLLIAINVAFAKTSPGIATALSIIAGAVMAVGIAYKISADTIKTFGAAFWWSLAGGAVAGLGFSLLMQKLMKPPKIDMPAIPEYDIGAANAPTYDTGGRIPMYDTGGRPHHRNVLVEPGETIISKTQNMAGGSAAYDSGGINIVIEGDVYDADNFASKIGEVLPQALNSASDSGSLAVRTTQFGSTFGKTAINRGTSIMEK